MISANDKLVPKAALIIYETASKTKDDLYVEVHGIDSKGNIKSGAPLDAKTANSLAKKITSSNTNVVGGEIHPGMLSVNYKNMRPVISWKTPKAVKYLQFDNSLNIPNGYAVVPDMIWKWDGSTRTLYVGALTNNTGHQIYYAPFHNIYAEMDVCLGHEAKNYVEGKTFSQIILSAENAFWKSAFSEIHEETTTVNINTYYMDAIAQNENTVKPFDYSILKPSPYTLKYFIA